MSNASRYGFSGPSVAMILQVPNSRSACSNDAAAIGMFGASGASGPARKNSTTAPMNSVLPQPFALPSRARRTISRPVAGS